MSRLSHKVCGLLTSPVLLRKFTLKIRGRRRQVKHCFKSEFAVFQSSSRLFRRCLFKVHDVTRDDSQRRFLAQHKVQKLEQRCSLSKRRRNNVLSLYVLRSKSSLQIVPCNITFMSSTKHEIRLFSRRSRGKTANNCTKRCDTRAKLLFCFLNLLLL